MKSSKFYPVFLIALFLYSSGFAQIKVFSDGKVGIGGADPSGTIYKLGVDGMAVFSNKVTFNHLNIFTGDYPSYFFKGAKFYKETSISGQSSDNYSLYVYGSPSSYMAYVNGSIYCTSLTESSDFRFKKNIQDFHNTEIFEKMSLLDAHQYEFKTKAEYEKTYISDVEAFRQSNNTEINDTIVYPKFPTGKRLGFIAQEVKEVYPEFVKIDSVTGYYGIEFTSFIPVLWEGVKAQNKLINELKIQIEALEAKLITQKSAVMDESLDTDLTITNSFGQNNPNPFTENTIIKYQVSNEINKAMMYIFDMNGKLIDNYSLTNGSNNELVITGNTLDAGMYIYTMVCDGIEIGSKRMILTK